MNDAVPKQRSSLHPGSLRHLQEHLGADLPRQGGGKPLRNPLYQVAHPEGLYPPGERGRAITLLCGVVSLHLRRRRRRASQGVEAIRVRRSPPVQAPLCKVTRGRRASGASSDTFKNFCIAGGEPVSPEADRGTPSQRPLGTVGVSVQYRLPADATSGRKSCTRARHGGHEKAFGAARRFPTGSAC